MKKIKEIYNNVLSALKRRLTQTLAGMLEKTDYIERSNNKDGIFDLKKRYNMIPMRELSRCENIVIGELVRWNKHLIKNPHNYYHISLPSLISKLARINHSSFEIDFESEEPEIKLTVSCQFENNLSTKSNMFRREFISLIYFIEYLKNEKLIYLVPEDKKNEIKNTFIDSTHRIMSEEIKNIEFIDFVKSLYNYNILPTEYLIKYYENGYKTKEEVRFNKAVEGTDTSINIANESVVQAIKSVKLTKCALYVAIGVGILSGGISGYSIYSSYDISNKSKIMNDSISIQQTKIDELKTKELDLLKESNANIQKELLELKNIIKKQ